MKKVIAGLAFASLIAGMGLSQTKALMPQNDEQKPDRPKIEERRSEEKEKREDRMKSEHGEQKEESKSAATLPPEEAAATRCKPAQISPDEALNTNAPLPLGCLNREHHPDALENKKGMLVLRWGNMHNAKSECANEGEKCVESVATPVAGTFSVSQGTLQIVKALQLEEKDVVALSDEKTIKIDTTIKGHWDGVILQYIPAPLTEGNTSSDRPVFTISLNGVTQTFEKSTDKDMVTVSPDIMFSLKGSVMSKLLGKEKDAAETLVKDKVEMENHFDELGKKIKNKNTVQEENAFAQVKESASSYNFRGQGQKKLMEVLDQLQKDITATDTPEMIQKKIEELKKTIEKVKLDNRAEKFTAGQIPFRDTDDNEWFADAVQTLKEKNIIGGFKDKSGKETGEFRPGNAVTVAEALKMVLSAFQKQPADGAPTLLVAQQHWSKGYVVAGEQLHLSLVKNLDNLDRPATRQELVLLLIEVLGITPEKASTSSFTDLTMEKNALYIDAIEYARAHQWISGDDGKTTFRPESQINRAEVAKLLRMILSAQGK